MKTTIRKLALRDQAAIVALWKSCEGLGVTDSDSREGIRTFLRRNPGLSFVAMKARRLVGTVLCGHDGRRGFIYHLAVAPAERRSGLGRRLATACLKQLRAAGIPKCHIVVFSDNHSGCAFWKSIGWEERQGYTLMSKLCR